MGKSVKQVINSIRELSVGERAAIAQSLITSLDKKPDVDVESAWMSVAQERLAEFENGTVKSVTWNQIKDDLNRK